MAEQDNPVFYKLVNSVTGHYYLGATSTPIGRERTHLKHIRAGKKPKKWQSMWNDHPQTRNDAVWRMHIVRCYSDMTSAVRCEAAFLQARVGNDPLCLNHNRTPNNMSGPLAGRKHSSKTKDKLRAANTGKTNSPETRAKLSAALSGDKHPRGFKGKTHSDETIAKMKEKISLAMTGRKHSPETIAKIKATHARRRAEKEAAKSSQ